MTSRRARRKDKKHNDRRRDDAWAAFAGGDLRRARRLYADLLAHAPGNARYRFELGLVELRAGRPEVAERAWRRVLLQHPHHRGARAALAQLGVDEGDAPAFGAGVELDEPPRTRSFPLTESCDWPRLARRLTQDGIVRVPRLFEPATFSEERRAALVEELEFRAAAIAARWSEAMGTERAPELSGAALEVVGDPPPEENTPQVRLDAGEHATVDVRPGRERRHAVTLRPGDAVLVCAARRPVRVGGVWGWQPVA